jgi:hypothetical protein
LRLLVFQALFAAVLLPALCAAQAEPESSDTGNAFLNRFWFSGQVNIISQGHPTFRSAYSDPNSFSSGAEIQTSRVITLYTGFIISRTTNFLFDLESTSGHDLSGSHGLGAFTNVDAAGVPNARPYVARAILHQQIPLSSKSTETERGPLQMAGSEAERRFDVYIGKMSLVDFFDVNAIGSDSHFQFLNWTLDNNGARAQQHLRAILLGRAGLRRSRGQVFVQLLDRLFREVFVDILRPKAPRRHQIGPDRLIVFRFQLHRPTRTGASLARL